MLSLISGSPPGREKQVEARPHVPARFIDAVAGHVVNCRLFPDISPLILGILGPPGTGKSWQVREVARQLGWHVVELSASSMAGDREGAVTRVLHEAYLRAVEAVEAHSCSFLLIDDFDLSLTSIRDNVETSQHTQLLRSSFMELCDRPEEIRNQFARRVPIVLTANSLDAVYAPLIRYGRMHIFSWIPTAIELEQVIDRMFPDLPLPLRRKISEKFGGEGLSFMRELRSEVLKSLVVTRIRTEAATIATLQARDVENEFNALPFEKFEAIGIRILADRKTLNHLGS